MADWEEVLTPERPGSRDLASAFKRWGSLRGGKTRNVDIVWFPKPITELTDMREKLKIAYEQQLKNKKEGRGEYFVENEVAEELVRLGAFTRPGTGTKEIVEEYKEEETADKPHISSFRMQNRLFRLLGWTTRRVGFSNQYTLTDLGIQMTKFNGSFPSAIGTLSERELVTESLLNCRVFNVNDNIDQWDTRFKQRIVVNVLRLTSKYGYISNNEVVVTAFALKDERDPVQVRDMMERLRRLHEGEISMIEAFEEVNVDPYDSSAYSNAYDNPKVLLSLCRQAELLFKDTVSLKSTPYGNLRQLYLRMHRGRSAIKIPRVVNLITEYGSKMLRRELERKVLWFDELS